ncbi:15063_t:CDS:2 [Entrophospora sp. SA101]|nr:15063_t:CDS:2 [Entrophospora sp. SA101]
MDEAARRQYCGLLMFDIPPQNLKRNNDVQFHIDKSTSTTTIVAKPIATAATTTATLTPAPAADTFIKSLLPQLSSSHDNNILNIIPSTGDADDPGYFIADNNNYEPSISSPLSPLTPLTPLPTPILSTPLIININNHSNSNCESNCYVIVDQNENLNLNSSSSLNPSLSPSLSSDIKFEFKHQK